MRLRWLPETGDDIQRLFDFLVKQDPHIAARAMELVGDGSNKLLDIPEIGRPMSDGSKRRELYLPFGNAAYVLRYRLDGDAVVIIRAWHSREHRA